MVGDDLVAGVGDPRALGWAGRVAARTRTEHDAVAATVMALGVPGESTTALRERWQGEAARRWGGSDDRLVVGLGHVDAALGSSLARSRLNLADVLDSAAADDVPAFVVGPPPPLDPSLRAAVAELAGGWAEVASRRGVPYVDCFGPLVAHEQWIADLEAGDGVHPGQVGYGLLAWLVLHGGWHAWLGLPLTP
ncbi:Lysophospholipase L1 [Quadrisphaera granulorum]|uniref:Lysophospholipase L1-like esterase n=1 Tax=Quadrisphaera granulorum TaxID=317664 RepID=A0A316ABS7_9ACTN|nr:GDSL-type esterase/lipase family protein [Quadrisphaera granulorum]PWJ54869.1 lysophospholipase L1-like esterase [Quadrisphaera granulorum]SZE95815.1 Lysophospholipase L1 [Quadrisphaera granulorum]